MAQITMDASNIGGKIHLEHTGAIQVPTDGLVTIDSRDLLVMINLGATQVPTPVAADNRTTDNVRRTPVS
jgi:hypothetical protein